MQFNSIVKISVAIYGDNILEILGFTCFRRNSIATQFPTSVGVGPALSLQHIMVHEQRIF